MTLTPARSVAAAAGLLGALLAAIGWLDYRAVSRELHAVVRSETDALHATVAAAARAQHAAAEHAEDALRQRLLDSARLLRELDTRGALTQAAIDDLVARNATYRVMLIGPDGRREHTAGEPGGQRDGRGLGGGRGRGRGLGAGPPPGAGALAQRLVAGGADEIVTPPHAARDGHERVAAGVRRTSGGAIVLNAANRTAEELDRVYSLGSLFAQIAQAAPTLAYLLLDEDGRVVAEGPLAAEAAAATTGTTRGERAITMAGARVLERVSTIDLGDDRTGLLRIGMRLDDVTRGERRTMARVSLGSAAAFGLGVIALAFVSLQQRYGRLSVEHARAQEALRRRDRLAAMGELASTVAHEVRNPLNAIAMSAQRLAREYPPPQDAEERDELEDLLGVIQRESERINRTVQQFLEFARPRPLNRRMTDLAAFLGEIVAAGRSLGASCDIHVQSRMDRDLRVSIDPDQLKPAVENLVRNAIDASPPGGTVLVEARRDGRSTTLSVSDQGPGIPPAILPRIFDLYFTTKTGGTGIGLPVAQQMVTAHGGTIEVDSRPGGGTRMIVRLPDEEARSRG